VASFFINMKRNEKLFFVENLTAELKSATAVVLIDFQGLPVKLQQELKKRLNAAGAKMIIVKNTLFKLASRSAKLSEQMISNTVLSGPNALVVTDSDPIAPIQILAKFASEFEMPQFKVGLVDGSFQDKENLIALAKLPNKETLLAQTAGTIASPLYGLLGILNGNLQKLVYILDKASKE